MCLILFAHNAHPNYPLILTANRDEFYARPTGHARFWAEHPELLAGRDLQAGGTWLGITRDGRFAAVTNYREGEHSDVLHSRGRLTCDFLLSEQTASEYLQPLQEQAGDYRGFNLLLGHPGRLQYFSNRSSPAQLLSDGIYALGNGTLSDNGYKTSEGKREFRKLIAQTLDPEALLRLMKDEKQLTDDKLPDTGIGVELERLLSARFIHSEHYGTRATTLLLVHQTGRIIFIEQNYAIKGADGGPQRFEFQIEAR